jgi:hypothetical protein
MQSKPSVSLTPRFSEVYRSLRFSQPLQRFPRVEQKPLKRLPLWRCSITTLKRAANGHSPAPDSFGGGCLDGAGRIAAARTAAFLRRK